MSRFFQFTILAVIALRSASFTLFESGKAVNGVNEEEKQVCDSPLSRMKSKFNDIFSIDHLNDWIPPANTFVPYNMMMDIKETEKSFDLAIDLPGVEKSDIKVSMDGNHLTVTAQRQTKKDEEGQNFKRTERFSGHISRTVHLPDNIDQDNIQAENENGVLFITMPKVKEGFRQTKSIDIK